jgi:hypothetical protein
MVYSHGLKELQIIASGQLGGGVYRTNVNATLSVFEDHD